MADTASQSFAAFLARSLDLLAHEAPAHLAAVREQMRGLVLRFEIGEQPAFHLDFDAEPWVGPGCHEQVIVAAAQAGIVALLDGSLSLEDAIDRGLLELRAELDDLLRCLDAFAAWLHGAVRCPSMPELYGSYLASVGARAAVR